MRCQILALPSLLYHTNVRAMSSYKVSWQDSNKNMTIIKNTYNQIIPDTAGTFGKNTIQLLKVK